jgi:hypothetical protein
MSNLNGILAEALAQAHAETGPLLLPKLLAAEQEVKEFTRSLPLLPDYDVHSVRDTVATKRAEVWAEAIAEHEADSAPIIASKLASAIFSYLASNSFCTFINGSLTAPTSGGPVVPSGPSVAKINYT